MWAYPLTIEQDDNGTLLVSFAAKVTFRCMTLPTQI